MDITITNPRTAATLAKMCDEYNARPGQGEGNTPLTLDEFCALELGALANAQADRLCPNSLPTGDWLQRWTPEEQAGALALAGQSDAVKGLWLALLQHATVELDNPELVAGVPQLCAALESIGVITSGQAATRAAEIMAY